MLCHRSCWSFNVCSGLPIPDTFLGENVRLIEVSGGVDLYCSQWPGALVWNEPTGERPSGDAG